MFKPVKQAKLTVQEFATIAGVSRVTASLWLNGHKKPHLLHASKISMLINAIDLAIYKEQLPLPTTVTRVDRIAKIKKIIAACIKDLKEQLK